MLEQCLHQAQHLDPNLMEQNSLMMEIVTSLPVNRDYASMKKAVKMQQLRAEALQAAQVPTGFVEPNTEITRLNVTVCHVTKL